MNEFQTARGLPESDPEAAERSRYEGLRRDLARAVAAICPSWLASDRDDLIQTAILKVMAIERRGEEVPVRSSSYLYRVAHSAVVDAIRSRRRRPEVPLEEEQVANDERESAPDPEDLARAREIGRGIRACLSAMKEERRVATVLRLLGHSVPEAAERLGWSAKRTENLVYRGLFDLLTCLTRRGLSP